MIGLKTLNIKFSCLEKSVKLLSVLRWFLKKINKNIRFLNEMSVRITVGDVMRVILSLGSVVWHSRC